MKCKKNGEKIVNNSVSCGFRRTKLVLTSKKKLLPFFLTIGITLLGLGFIVSLNATISVVEPKTIFDTLLSDNYIKEQEPLWVPDNEENKLSKENNTVVEIGTTLSYTEQINNIDIKTFFVFTSQTDVIWLFGTPKNNKFPVGFGKYDPSTGDVTFSAYNKLHKGISLYYGVDAIVFNMDIDRQTAILKYNDSHIYTYLSQFYNNGKIFSLSKENYTLKPSKILVGSRWKIEDENAEIYFRTWNEAWIIVNNGDEEQVCAYVCLGKMVSIKSGDNITDENMIGQYYGGNEMTICREGILPDGDKGCITIREIDAE